MDGTRPCEFPVSLSFRVRRPSCEKKATASSSSLFPRNLYSLCWRNLRRCPRISPPSRMFPLMRSSFNALPSGYQHRFRSRPQPAGKSGKARSHVGEKHVCTSIIVAAELRYGADKKGSPRLSSQLDAVLGALEVLPFETPADTSYGQLRTRLEKAGTPIVAIDLRIVAQALALGYVIVTRQRKRILPGQGAATAKLAALRGIRMLRSVIRTQLCHPDSTLSSRPEQIIAKR